MAVENHTIIPLEVVTRPAVSRGAVCAHLGLADDQETWLAFPGPENHCHLLQKAVSEAHQAEYCLSARCVECPFARQYVAARPAPWQRVSAGWVQKASGNVFIWLLLGWMVRLIIH